ncbi:secreted protein [Purpureocillium lavendulum]|uniref:Secreted protein n=1 Tax=Purpureocillium lavendulum TaxID=1247861 RepID=A0AB34G109_9HYPO|nr:secreted protein [Purpureocillium lavendulum]
MITVGAATAGTPPADQGPGGTAPVRPFRLDQVSLGDGLFQEKRDRLKSFIKEYDERRFLVLFNNQAGRPNPDGVEVPGGWEDGGLLSGHWTGHYMTALSQAYADKGEDVFKSKLDWMVEELAACQKAITVRMSDAAKAGTGDASWIPTHPGYLGALPEDTVLRLGPPRWAVYGSSLTNNTWAPWYTQHKIMRGLLDSYYNTNNSQALDVVKKMADWAYLALTIGDKNNPKYTGNLTRDDLNYMWDLYIAGEYGGANEVFPEIYELTGDSKHLQTAKAFDNRESLFGAAVDDHDILVVTPDHIPGRRRQARLHANTHVPQFIGYMSVYEHSGEQEYFDAAKNFYSWVMPHRRFAHGGIGGNYPGSNDNPELFQNRDNIANAIADNGAETCTTYNLLKLARYLFLHEHNATYMDNYERGLLNMIAGSRRDTSNNSDPQVTYFQPLTPGAVRDFGNTGTCCGGTGMESHTKYQETVYFRSADGSALWVNLYMPSTLNWAAKGFKVKQETKFPREDTAKFTVNGHGPLDIKLRVPGWVRKGFQVTINGRTYSDTQARPGSYLTISRSWKSGDMIEVKMPFTMRTERALDRPDTQSLMWGPLVLQLIGNSTTESGYHELSLYRYLKRDGDYSRAAVTRRDTTPAGDQLFETTDGHLPVRPYYIGDESPTSSYLRRVEPHVVFGTIDTQVPNRKRNDGLPYYDVPVEGVPSSGTDGPTFLDVLWDQAPFATHAAFLQAVTSTMDAFVGAGIYTPKERDTVLKKARQAEKELAP